MKNIIILFVLTIVNVVNAQNFCGKVIYKEEVNYSYPNYIRTYKTQFNDKSCFSACMTNEVAKNSSNKKQREILKKYYEEKGMQFQTSFSDGEGVRLPYYYLKKDESFFAHFCEDIDLYVKESPFKWNWKLLEGTKKIGKYTCKKASIRFRKRDFIAWYTTDIPASFGPKKFKGLPGLILQINDADQLWSMSAIEVKIDKKKCIFNKEDINKFKKPIDIVTYLKERDEEVKRDLIRFGTKMGVVGRKVPTDNYHATQLYNGAMQEIFDKYPLTNKKRK